MYQNYPLALNYNSYIIDMKTSKLYTTTMHEKGRQVKKYIDYHL